MKENRVYVVFCDLSPELDNLYIDVSHSLLITILRKYFKNWIGFFEKHENYSLGFYITTKKGVGQLEIKGPSISRKMQIVDFSIFLPEEIRGLDHHTDLVFEGILLILQRFNVSEADVLEIKQEFKLILNQ